MNFLAIEFSKFIVVTGFDICWNYIYMRSDCREFIIYWKHNGNFRISGSQTMFRETLVSFLKLDTINPSFKFFVGS